ncbi:hypothetical protein [Comamonas thiooxydans]|uniref:hypothetical protein n=1 Tax=Comamonas thiooxydans TaxID=363952 RepID=UPI0005A23155|nr:hypothetical protein [Comamonas thiooxydans]MDO1474698.1 hypothetical protein [Comamonas thiooxydans]
MQIDHETVQRWVQEKRDKDGYASIAVDLYLYVAQRAAEQVNANQSVAIPNQPGLNIDLTRMREAALHAQIHGSVFKAGASQVRQVLDYLHERTLEIKRLNARILDAGSPAGSQVSFKRLPAARVHFTRLLWSLHEGKQMSRKRDIHRARRERDQEKRNPEPRH